MKFDIPVVLEVEAPSYEEAIKKVTECMVVTNHVTGDDVEASIPSHEHDNDGQRVIYLHPENEPEEECCHGCNHG